MKDYYYYYECHTQAKTPSGGKKSRVLRGQQGSVNCQF